MLASPAAERSDTWRTKWNYPENKMCSRPTFFWSYNRTKDLKTPNYFRNYWQQIMYYLLFFSLNYELFICRQREVYFELRVDFEIVYGYLWSCYLLKTFSVNFQKILIICFFLVFCFFIFMCSGSCIRYLRWHQYVSMHNWKLHLEITILRFCSYLNYVKCWFPTLKEIWQKI